MTQTLETIDPVTGRVLHAYPVLSEAEVEAAVAKGHEAALSWGRMPVAQRAELLRKLASVLRESKGVLADLITAEMGKILGEAGGEVEKSAATALYYADNAERLLSDRSIAIDGVESWVSYEPVGLVLAVMPWNFPVWQVMRCAIPALAAGNGMVLKHSPNVTGSALAMERIFLEAGFPAHLFTTLVLQEAAVPQTIDRLIADPRIAGVSLTGSNRAGAAVGAAAGRASKPSVLELGGSDAFVVLDDADLAKAVPAAVKARFNNAGQSCVCAKRFILSRAIAETFTDAFVRATNALEVGNPRDPRTSMGPLARGDLRDALDDQVKRSLKAGAVLLAGGGAFEGKGFFYQPTILGNCGPGIAAFDEETFGPVAAISIVDSDEEAISLANATQYGLSISIWTADQARAINFAKQVTTGAVFVNAMTASDARVPFGGTKKSGYGRELAGEGLHAFTNIRTYWTSAA